MKSHSALAAALALAMPLLAVAAPRPDEYAQGVRVDAFSGRAVAEVLLPDEVYRQVTREDLGDLRVFNADGVAVPHAFCAAPTRVESTVSRNALRVFELQGPTKAGTDGTRVEVETSAGTQVRVQEGNEDATASGTQTWAHVIDARAIEDQLRAIEFDWTSPDGASQAQVRIESSTDLDEWRTVVNATTLLRVSQGDQQLQRKVVRLTPAHYDYLRVVRTDGGPPLRIAEAIGEHVSQGSEVEPVWFTATPMPTSSASELLFDAAHLAPITYARVVLPTENSSVRVAIQSRANEKSQWRERWSGEVYSILNNGERRVSPPAQLDTDFDRYWRIAYAKPADGLSPAPSLELDYRPSKLRFLAQGAGPFTLAFGSRRAELSTAQGCGSLLADVTHQDMEQFIGEASLGPSQVLGGESAFKPLPAKTPVRLMVLWGVLIAGAALLIAMALSLLKRVNGPPA
ncbi:MAG: DUF3999 domain-containing protein [Povalibacter sp.]